MNEGTKQILRQAGLGDKVDMVEKAICPTCGESVEITDFTDDLSKKEFEISGCCQRCQDEIFTCE